MVTRSPEDAATYRQWRRAVCCLYAAIAFILVAVSAVHQLGKRDEAQIAGSLTPVPAVKAVGGEGTPPGR